MPPSGPPRENAMSPTGVIPAGRCAGLAKVRSPAISAAASNSPRAPAPSRRFRRRCRTRASVLSSPPGDGWSRSRCRLTRSLRSPMALHVLAQSFPQRGPGPVEPAADGRRLDAQKTACLLCWPAEPLHQHEGLPVADRERCEGRRKLRPRLCWLRVLPAWDQGDETPGPARQVATALAVAVHRCPVHVASGTLHEPDTHPTLERPGHGLLGQLLRLSQVGREEVERPDQPLILLPEEVHELGARLTLPHVRQSCRFRHHWS